MKKKTQRLRVPVTMALRENWSVPIRRVPTGSRRQSGKSGVRVIQIQVLNEPARVLAARISGRSRVVL